MRLIENVPIAIWTFLVLSPLLVHSHILWGFTALAISVLIVAKSTATTEFPTPQPVLVFSFGLIIAILVAAVARRQTAYDLEQAAKLLLILLVALPLFTQTPARRSALWAGSEAALYANAAAIAAGIAINPVFFGLQGFARFGTCFASPGSLWRVGAIGIATAFRAGDSTAKHARARQAICLVISIALIAVDGSRTGMLVGGIAALVGLCKLIRRLYYRPLSALLTCLCLFTGGAVAYQSPAVNEAVETYGVIARIQDRIDSSGAGGVSAEDMDFARRNMLADVLTAIEDHPIVGSGMGTTMTQTEAGMMVVHLSYLQVWADTGLPGFLSYTLLMLSGVWLALRRPSLSRPRTTLARSADITAVPWYGVYIAAGWALAGFFHPVSTEASEWIWFILAMALIADYAPGAEKNGSMRAPAAQARITD